MQTKSRRRAGWLGGAALAALLVAVAAPAARATTMTTDPLHGFCNGASPSCADNGTNTPLGGSTQFGFSASSAAKTGTTGTLTLDILLPNVYAQPASFSITGIGTNPSGTATEVSKTAWTSGALDTYLGISRQPDRRLFADDSDLRPGGRSDGILRLPGLLYRDAFPTVEHHRHVERDQRAQQ